MPELRYCIITETGWRPAEIGAMAFPEALGLWRYWQTWPPSHRLLRNIAGYRPQHKPEQPSDDMEFTDAEDAALAGAPEIEFAQLPQSVRDRIMARRSN